MALVGLRRRRAAGGLAAVSRGLGHGEQGLAVNLETVDAVLGLDVNLRAGRLAEYALDRRRDHAVSVRVAEDHHASTDHGVTDQVPRIDPTERNTRPLSGLVADLPRRDANHAVRPRT